MADQRQRTPGDRVPGAFVREVRTRAGLTQEQFAKRLGVRGGKGVISAWESDTSACEGPAAELILQLFGGDLDFSRVSLRAETAWGRVPNPYDMWRQIAAVPRERITLDRDRFVRLFPDAAIPSEQYKHGFPFIDADLHAHGLSTEGWIGAIPSDPKRPLAYWWLMQRDGSFVYREKNWEADERSVTNGHLHIASLFKLALATTHFLRQLAHQCNLKDEVEYGLQMRLGGMLQRGIVLPHPHAKTASLGLVDEPPRLSASNEWSVETTAAISELRQDPVPIGVRLVGEAVLLLRPDDASDAKLTRVLRKVHQLDKQDRPFRDFGYLDT
jgi:transcriptional regulator with XRE-family HTH domain